MLNLIVKDLMIQKKFFLFVPLYVAFLAPVFAKPPMSVVIYPMVSAVVVFTLTMNAIVYDDKNRSEVLLNSLPIKRGDIVLAKYLSILLYLALALATAAIFMLVVNAIGLKSLVKMPGTADLVGSLAVAIFLGSFIYPLYFKFGSIKIRYVTTVLFMAMFFLPGLLMDYLKAPGRQTAIQNLITKMAMMPDWLQLTGITAVLLAMLLISLALSLRIYGEKEF